MEKLLEEYLDCKEKEEFYKKQKEEISKKIKEKLTANSWVGQKYQVNIIKKTTFSYIDDTAIITYLKNNHLNYLYKEAIITTGLNAELKKNGNIAKQLKNFYTININECLSVSEVKNG